jgi:hypothetical protein
LNHKQEKTEWELLAESGNVQLDKLISIYNENPFYARVIYKQKINYETERMVAFRFTNGDINIIKLSESMVFLLLIKCTLVNAML